LGDVGPDRLGRRPGMGKGGRGVVDSDTGPRFPTASIS
ncbi:MAG: hypothetical protein JWQ60_2364, partial [Pseudonocardia sp.]|nr:hypothetical protein [Pseudonocardia sp.]